MIQLLEYEEQTFLNPEELMQHLTTKEENTRRQMVQIRDITLTENGVRIGASRYPIKERAFYQLMKLTSMDWGQTYFTKAPVDLIVSDFERMKRNNPELQCRVVFENNNITSFLPQESLICPYDQFFQSLEIEGMHFGCISDDGLRLTSTLDVNLDVDPEVGDIIQFGKDLVYSNTNWSRYARVSPFLLRLICTNGVSSKNNEIFREARCMIPSNGDIGAFINKVVESLERSEIKTDLLLRSLQNMKNTSLKDIPEIDRFIPVVKYWLEKDVFESSTEINRVVEDKIQPNLDCNTYSFFNEITSLAKRVSMVRRKKVEECAGQLIECCLNIENTTLRQL